MRSQASPCWYRNGLACKDSVRGYDHRGLPTASVGNRWPMASALAYSQRRSPLLALRGYSSGVEIRTKE